MCSRVFKAFQETSWRFKTLAFVANGVKLQNRNLNFHVLEVLGGGGLIAPNSSWVNTSSGASRECNRRVKSFTFPFSVSFSLNLSHSLAHKHSPTCTHTHTRTDSLAHSFQEFSFSKFSFLFSSLSQQSSFLQVFGNSHSVSKKRKDNFRSGYK